MFELDGYRVNKWRYGKSEYALSSELRSLSKAGWNGCDVFVDGFTTFWWEGTAEVIQSVREHLPNSRVMAIGAYAALAPVQAVQVAGADEARPYPAAESCSGRLDLGLNEYPSGFSYVHLGAGAREADDVVDEIGEMSRGRVYQHFAFTGGQIAEGRPEQFEAVLEEVVRRELRVCLYALGDIAPHLLIANPGLASLMKRAGYHQICFADDRNVPATDWAREQRIDELRRAAELCRQAGFRFRSDQVVASVSVGRADHTIEDRAQAITLAAHFGGSVIVWPYQPAPAECPGLSLEQQNGKYFPLREQSGATYRDYLDLLGLATLLSSKYREETFDFMGDGLIPRLFRESLARRGWDPDPSVKGGLRLPVLARS